MNTKEAIKAVESCKSMHADDLPYGEDAAYDYLKRKNVVLDKVIECLQRGDKFEKIVRDVKTVLLSGYFIDHAPELERFRRLFKDIEQIYFPKDEVIK